MATYAIGDIQGCYKSLKRLLKHIGFNQKQDRLFLVGDLVNRGPNSLDVLRWAYDLQDRVVTVLGNHDLHLLALALGVKAVRRKKHTLDKVLEAKDADALVFWLQEQPLMYKEGRLVLVHGGILPAWSIQEAKTYAKETEKILRSKRAADLLEYWYTADGTSWRDSLEGYERHATILNAFTRIRVCKNPHLMDFDFTGKPEDAPFGLKPWFDFDERRHSQYTVIFGHWAALGLRIASHIIALDTGCIWGGSLTAVRLEDGAIFSHHSEES